MKTIYQTNDYPDVLIKKGMLEQAGFLVYVDNLNSAGGAMPELGFTVGYKVMVPDSDVEEAVAFLSETPESQDDVTSAIDPKMAEAKPSPSYNRRNIAVLVIVIILVWLVTGSGVMGSDSCPFSLQYELRCHTDYTYWNLLSHR